MPLPLRFVKEIHSRLQVRYGSAWTTKWAGLDQESIEADWADQLDGMKAEHIKQALASLPDDFPPTATAFRKLGSLREEAKVLSLPPPDPEGLRRIAQSMAPVVNHQETPEQWMARLEKDVKAGTANPSRKRHYAIAVKNGYYGHDHQATNGPFTPPPNDVLPPGMRK